MEAKLLNILFLTLLLNLALPTSSIKIKCQPDESIKFEAFPDFTYSCEIKYHGRPNHVTELIASPRDREMTPNVNGLAINQNRELKAFPHGIDQIFTDLMGIDLQGCGLQKISKEDLQPFQELVQLTLNDNRLEELPHNLFIHNKKLKRIDLGTNSILHIGRDIFSHLPQLTFVDIRENPCTSDESIADDEDELEALKWELAIECPATMEMLTLSLASTKEFVTRVKEIFKRNSEELRRDVLKKIEKLEGGVESLRKRL